MKRTAPYIIMVIVVAAMTVLIVRNSKPERKLNERISLRKSDKIPYGTYVAFHNLKYLFPYASISVDHSEPGYWDSLSITDERQALIIITPQFLSNDREMEKLIAFAGKGNSVFISTTVLSYSANDFLKCETFGPGYGKGGYLDTYDDSLKVTLLHPPFEEGFECIYPGKKFDHYFFKYDSSISYVFGKNGNGDVNFIRLSTGNGNIYIHLAPLAFSNYFLLHKNNIAYYEHALSVIPAKVKKLVWDEYYIRKLYEKHERRSLLSVLFRYPSLKWGLLTAIIALLAYVLLEMRRKQRPIPVLAKPRNDSLDFVKTIGRLYYDKKDHQKICRKMAAYFLEHVRNRYKLPTNNLDQEFVKTLHLKSGYDQKELSQITSFIDFIDTAPAVSDNQLTHFYKQLELFYKAT